MESFVKPPKHISRADRQREQELYKYYRPEQHNVGPSEANGAPRALSPDTTLTALAQLVAVRLEVKSVLINVITKDTQYTISEGTKTLNLADTTQAENNEDALWIGCASLNKNESLCENTIKLAGIFNGTNPFFTVPDLSKDERFKDYFYVKGIPHWRFYSGCPLITKKNVNIGALCILDDKPRDGLTTEQEQFANTMSQVIMRQLEMYREADERRKGTRMSRGLNAFVEGKTQFSDRLPQTRIDFDDRNDRPASNGSYSNNNSVLSAVPFSVHSPADRSGATTPSQDDQPCQVHNDIDVQQRATFSRAAGLLRESLDLQHGGVVFLDAVVGFSAGNNETLAGSANSTETSSKDDEAYTFPIADDPKCYNQITLESSSRSETDPRSAGVLGDSVESSLDQTGVGEVRGFTPLSETALQQLIKAYPRGKLWSFDDSGFLSSEEDQPPQRSGRAPATASKGRIYKKIVGKCLENCIPSVRQLIFVPLWDAALSRYFSGCFVWSISSLQIFSAETELSFVAAFGNSVMAEVSRIAAIAADQQKGDFIGSISHELRSPLHGILASAEFLGETECDSFQMSLVNTIDSCGRTLLDTINHVLDFSKINSFERNHKKRTRARTNDSSRSARNQMPQTMNICATTDVAAVTEEVVEGVWAGYQLQEFSSNDISDFTPGTRGLTSERGLAINNRYLPGGTGAQLAGKVLDVVLIIEPGDYTFTTQPGALRRIIMNLVTNSLKYTDEGLVLVKLANNHSTDKENGQLVELTVSDTGRGISGQYLRTRLFTPFAQENNLNPGTGLGLSMVRSICTMLDGSVDIRSEISKGTEVTVLLPLLRVPGADTPSSTPGTIGSIEHAQDDSISLLKSEASGKVVALYGFELSGKTSVDVVTVETAKALRQYISEWYDFEILTSWPSSGHPEIVIVDEANLSRLIGLHTLGRPLILVLCTNAFRPGLQQNLSGVEFLSKPFGPYKLARALRLCLEKLKSGNIGPPSLPGFSISDSTAHATTTEPLLEFEAMTIATGRKNSLINAQTTGVITAGDSENALMAVETSPMTGNSSSTINQDFPFPKQSHPIDDAASLSGLARHDSMRPDLLKRKTEPLLTNIEESTPSISAVSQEGETASGTALPNAVTNAQRPPRLLVVDDNRINLRLLKTFMRKRNYQLVDSAENGQLAVQAAEMQKDGYDVIFMDISMPVMNGFEATRAIRQIERSRRTGSLGGPAPALIIALTGLASSRDQSEAFTSGVDLFMTKPVSFKEVGRLLDNWEANSRGPKSRSSSISVAG